jgi:hypothetical protein
MNKQQIDQIVERIRKQQEIVDRNYIRAYNAPSSTENEFIMASCKAWYAETVEYLEELQMKWC